ASLSATGVNGVGASRAAAMSGTGTRVAFVSEAANLVPGDTNAARDVFVRDRLGRTTVRASVASDGTQASGDNITSDHPAISANGRFVAFDSNAANLVPLVPSASSLQGGDTNKAHDVFVRDLAAGTTTRVSVSSAGAEANRTSTDPAVSADGRFVAFVSFATNLVGADTNGDGTCDSGCDTNNTADVFVRDRDADADGVFDEAGAVVTERVNVSSGGDQAAAHSGTRPAISAEGRYVAFVSRAANLVAGDTNEAADVFVRDRVTRTTERASVSDTGAQASGTSAGPSLSGDGNLVAFDSRATNLVAGDTNGVDDVFVRDRRAGTTIRASVSSTGAQANNVLGGGSQSAAISADGRFVAFDSRATNLVAGDTNGAPDVFVRDLTAATTMRVSVEAGGAQATFDSTAPALSADGNLVAFQSNDPHLVVDDLNSTTDVFVFDQLLCSGKAPTIVGTPGADAITGTGGADVISAMGGNDSVDGAKGNDVVCGGEGADTLRGGTGDDTIFGEAGDDSLFGDAGNDTLDGGAGADACDGGAGSKDKATAGTCEKTSGVP
ncbi:MAG: hypothetical protein M3Q48_12775, partial [Actinomycetota bacterium]|nr:hypothetical protein [Actinomycetota bacterium]